MLAVNSPRAPLSHVTAIEGGRKLIFNSRRLGEFDSHIILADDIAGRIPGDLTR